MTNGSFPAVITRLLMGACLLLPACSRPASLSCDVDLRAAAEGWADVTCRARGPAAGIVSIKQMAQDRLVRASAFRAAGPSGAPLTVLERPDLSMGRDARWFTERIIPPESAPAFEYGYRVRPGAWTGDAMRGSRGRRLGWLGERGGLLSGRNLLLLPSWYRSLEEIDLTFRMPEGWIVTGTPPGGPSSLRARGAGIAAALLVESAIGVGRFGETRVDGPGGSLRLALHEDLPPGTRETILRAVPRGFAFLAERLGPPSRDYTLILAPPPPDGSLVLVPPSAAGLASEILAPGPAQLQDIFYAMARARTDSLISGRQVAAGDRWLAGALPSFYAVAALDAAGARSASDSWAMRARGARQGLGSLTRPPRSEDEATLGDLHAKGTYLLAAAQLFLLKEGAAGDGRGIEPAVARLASPDGNGTGFLDHLGGISPAAGRALHDVADSDGAIPEEWIAAVNGEAPLELSPSPVAQRGAGPVGARRLRLLVTGNSHGMLEVCGCKARQLGGLARRESIRRRLVSGGTPLLMVDLGNAYSFDARDPILTAAGASELEVFLELMGRQAYAAAAPGHTELLRGAEFFARTADRRPLPYVNANLRLEGHPLALPRRVTSAGGIRVGWISALEPRDYTGDHARFYEQHMGGLDVSDPAAALAESARALAGRADLVVAIGALSPRLVRRLIETVPEIDAVLSTESPDAALDGTFRFPTDGESELLGFHSGRMVFFSTGEGKWLEEIALDLGRDGSIAGARVSRHLLGEEVPEDPAFRGRLASFYDSMKDAPELAGSGEPVARSLPALLDAPYAGEAACRPCHEGQWRDWRDSPHGSAFSTLLARHRHYAPGCVGCHVTGYGHGSGYRIGDPTESMRHVQCEMCHGPGARHVREPSARNIVRRPPREACLECHAPDHSDMTQENFEEYYRRTLHSGSPAGRAGSP